jgi:cell wall-associated NlpC family hydrolase
MRSILLLSILLFGACSSTKHDAGTADSDVTAKSLVSYARSLIGIRYKYGGNSPKTGFDCSGFVSHVFRHTTGIILPRESGQMSRIGQVISIDNLRVGDLVFFNTLHHKFSHVGIYLGGDRFIHAPSTSTGSVRTDNMRDDYWKKHYDGARRITFNG